MQKKAWQSDYLLTLIYDFRGNRKKALERIENYTERINFAPFYVLRARLTDSNSVNSKLKDIELASVINPKEWRYGIMKSKLLFQLDQSNEALQEIGNYYNADKKNYIVGMFYIRSLVNHGKYKEAETVLSDIHILPFEGASDARRYYRETKLSLADQALRNNKFKVALKKVDEALEWANRLGVGKPFEGNIDENLENWMKGLIYKKMGNNKLSKRYFDKVKDPKINDESYVDLIRSISSRGDERLF